MNIQIQTIIYQLLKLVYWRRERYGLYHEHYQGNQAGPGAKYSVMKIYYHPEPPAPTFSSSQIPTDRLTLEHSHFKIDIMEFCSRTMSAVVTVQVMLLVRIFNKLGDLHQNSEQHELSWSQ